ncbi:MAG: hypothetical protein C0494_11780 [Sphingobium sp.]|nr:hypothetical protein [Sphingobium sp.]
MIVSKACPALHDPLVLHLPMLAMPYEAIIKSVGEKRDQIMASILIQPFPRIERMLMLLLANSQVYDFIVKSIT